jgi:hypothetical protein
MRPSLLVPVLVVLAFARPVCAQSLAPGSRVRVQLSSPSGEMLEGDVAGITADSIFIGRPELGQARLGRGSVTRLFIEIRQHRELSGAMGVLAGAPLGMLAGALIGPAVAKGGAGHKVVGGIAGAAAGLVVGAFVGGTLGHARPGISWYEIPWPTEFP